MLNRRGHVGDGVEKVERILTGNRNGKVPKRACCSVTDPEDIMSLNQPDGS